METGGALFIVSSADITAGAVVPGTEEHHRYKHSQSNDPGDGHLNTPFSLLHVILLYVAAGYLIQMVM